MIQFIKYHLKSKSKRMGFTVRPRDFKKPCLLRTQQHPCEKNRFKTPPLEISNHSLATQKKIVLTSSLVLFDYLLINLDSLVGAVDCRSPPTPLHSAHLRDGTRASPKPNRRSDPATSRGSHPGPTTPRISPCEGVGSTLDHHGLVMVADFGRILGIGLCEYPMSM